MKIDIDIQNHDHFSFDLWLTLIKSHPEFKAKRVELFSSFFDVKKTIDEVAKTVKYYDDLCNNINEINGGNIDTFEIYLLILSSLEVDVKKLDSSILNAFYQKTEDLFLEYHPQIIVENIHDLLEGIKNQRKTINVLSNTGFIKGSTMRKFLANVNLSQYFDFQIYSDEVMCSKPNPKIFQEVINNLAHKNLNLNKILHIGDNPVADYQGAKNFGFNAFLI